MVPNDTDAPVTSQAVRAFINRMIDEATPLIGASTVALYGVQNDAPVQNGSAVLVKIADVGLLLSAAHVLDYATVHEFPYLIGGASGGADLIPLEDVVVHTTGMPKSKDRADDPFDIAVVPLPSSIVEKLESHKRFLRLSQIDPLARIEQGNYYCVYGFPYELTSTDHQKRAARVTAFRYGTNALQNAVAEIREFDQERDVVFAAPQLPSE